MATDTSKQRRIDNIYAQNQVSGGPGSVTVNQQANGGGAGLGTGGQQAPVNRGILGQAAANQQGVQTTDLGQGRTKLTDPSQVQTQEQGRVLTDSQYQTQKPTAFGIQQGPEKPQLHQVQGQSLTDRINTIIDQNSPLMKQARTIAKQQANQRGLLGSSLSVQAGQQAVLQQAAAIGANELQLQQQVDLFNAEQQNKLAMMQYENQWATEHTKQRAGIEFGLLNRKGEIDKELQTADHATQQQLLQERGQIEKDLAFIQRDTELKLTNRKAEIDSQLLDQKGGIDMDLLLERGEIDKDLENMRTKREMDLTNRRGEIEKELQTADHATQIRLVQERGTIDKELEGMRTQRAKDLQAEQSLIDQKLTELRGDIEKDLLNRKGEIDLQLQTAEGEIRHSLLREQGEIDLQLQELRGGQALDQISARGEIEKDLVDRRGEIDIELSKMDAKKQMDLLNRRGEIDKELQTADHANQLLLLQERGEIEKELANINNLARTTLQQEAFDHEVSQQEARIAHEAALAEAARLVQQGGQYASTIDATMANIANINAAVVTNPDGTTTPLYSEEAKQEAIREQWIALRNKLIFLGATEAEVAWIPIGSISTGGGGTPPGTEPPGTGGGRGRGIIFGDTGAEGQLQTFVQQTGVPEQVITGSGITGRQPTGTSGPTGTYQVTTPTGGQVNVPKGEVSFYSVGGGQGQSGNKPGTYGDIVDWQPTNHETWKPVYGNSGQSGNYQTGGRPGQTYFTEDGTPGGKPITGRADETYTEIEEHAFQQGVQWGVDGRWLAGGKPPTWNQPTPEQIRAGKELIKDKPGMRLIGFRDDGTPVVEIEGLDY